MKTYTVYLVSDFTCETIASITRAIFVNFDSISFQSEMYPLIKTKDQINELLQIIQKKPGIVMCTIFNKSLQNYLVQECKKINTICIPAISGIVEQIEAYCQEKINKHPKTSRNVETNKRIEAIEYTLIHDDGQKPQGYAEADIIITGVSRTSKSPTSMYLAYRCFKVMNIPFINSEIFPKNILQNNDKKFIIGLTINADKLVGLRENRILNLVSKSTTRNSYTDYIQVKQETKDAQKFFLQNKWDIIDVTHSSVEETAAKIIQKFNLWKNKCRK